MLTEDDDDDGILGWSLNKLRGGISFRLFGCVAVFTMRSLCSLLRYYGVFLCLFADPFAVTFAVKSLLPGAVSRKKLDPHPCVGLHFLPAEMSSDVVGAKLGLLVTCQALTGM
jgi:hypothetical protein